MLGYGQVRRLIESSFDSYSGLPIKFENVENIDEDSEYIYIEISDINSENLDLSGSVMKTSCVLDFSIFTKQGSGSQKAREEASAIWAILRNVQSSNEVAFTLPEFGSGELIKNTGMYYHRFSVEMTYFYGQEDVLFI